MKTAILSVGTEILMGQIVNTNAVYLSRELNNLGFDVMYHHTVGDNTSRLEETLELLCRDCDIVITTGGLGPTQDDLTKETVAKFMHDELVMHKPSMDALIAVFQRQGRNMTENNIKQAFFPSRSDVFENPHGTAPGFALREKGRCIICLPGPPREMKEMFENKARPYLEKMADGAIVYRIIRTFGIGESSLETELLDLINEQSDPTIATYAKEGESYLRVASKRPTPEEAEKAVSDMIKKVEERIGKYIYSESDEELSEVVSKALLDRGLTISAAESCTGGLFAKTMTDMPGISRIFEQSLVTYSNEAKIRELGVKKETLDEFGAVSEEVAWEMAEGLARASGSDISISVTGVAGPDGGTVDKPVGLVYIGLGYRGKIKVKKLKMRDTGRDSNRSRAVLNMFAMIHKEILSNEKR